MRKLVYVLMGIFTFLIQAQVFPALIHQYWLPNLFLIWVTLLASIKGRKVGLVVAGIAGLVHDIVISNFFGLHFFPYLVVAYLVSALRSRLYEEQWYISVLTVIGATIIDALVRLLMLYLIKADVQVGTYLWHLVWPSIWANAILAIIIHKLLWNLEEKEEYIW